MKSKARAVVPRCLVSNMALIQISEPGAPIMPQKPRYAAGIDLGTTNSLIAIMRGGVADTLPDEAGVHALASVVRYLSDEVVVGRSALKAAVEDPLNTVMSVKRLMGRAPEEISVLRGQLTYRFKHIEGTVARIETVAGMKTPTEISCEILKVLKQRAEAEFDAQLDAQLDGVVITVPAYFDDAQRQATKDAANLADLNVLRLLNEPTAAAIAYGLDRRDEGVIAIFDLGGGTFDVSVLKFERGVLQVLATGGDTALGGDDFDRLIAEYLINQSDYIVGDEPETLRSLLRDSQAFKEQLSKSEEVKKRIELPDGRSWEQSLTRGTMNELIKPLMEKVVTVCHEVVHDAEVKMNEIKEVVMVGGSTRLPLVRERVEEVFGRKPLTNIDPDRVVAIGAAIQADVLVGNNSQHEMLLLDVVSLSLGIETMGELVEKIIPRNTAIPVVRTKEFTTFKDGQTGMSIHVVQGERELVSECRSLAHFELKGLPQLVAGAARIRVTFQVDADGLLTVEAEETTQNVKASLEVCPSYGLSNSEIEAMIKNSMAHASEDMQARRLRESELEARRVIEALDSALATDGEALLDPSEMTTILEARKCVQDAMDSGNPDVITSTVKSLEQCSEAYVARRMNHGVQQVMRGRSVKEFTKKEQ